MLATPNGLWTNKKKLPSIKDLLIYLRKHLKIMNMSLDNSPVLTRKTWERAMEPINKIGYMDGASDGQSSVYQQSFDVGYEQGISFGLHLGFLAASMRLKEKENPLKDVLLDPRRINCQVCLNKPEDPRNIADLCNNQNKKILTMIASLTHQVDGHHSK